MMVRVQRFPPLHARLIRLEEGPPMYRMLGYADENNIMSDLCNPIAPGVFGPFAVHRLPPNQSLPFGAAKFGLPSHPLPYRTVYFDENCAGCNNDVTPYHLIEQGLLPEPRLEEILFPEMAVPGSGIQSRVTNSGFLYRQGIPPPRAFVGSTTSWRNLNMHSGYY